MGQALVPVTYSSLPDIPLPKFSGSFADWHAFKSLFKSLVIEDKSLTALKGLHYLRSALSGEPADLVSNGRR